MNSDVHEQAYLTYLLQEYAPESIEFNPPDKTESVIPAQKKPLQLETLPGLVAIKTQPVVNHLILSKDLSLPAPSQLPEPFLAAVKEDAQKQQVSIQEYSRQIGEKTLFYVIRQHNREDKSDFLVSYAWGNYRNDLVSNMLIRLLQLMFVAVLICLLPSLWLARYLTRPLVQMETHLARIAERDWHEPFSLDRKDEIGRLSQSFEYMRQKLVSQDKTRQSFLQNISHELKTPVMVIRSYTQSILDHIYPKGNLENSVTVIDSEAKRLEKRVNDLLDLSKLNYLASRERQLQLFDLSSVLQERIAHFRLRRQELQWEVILEPLCINGDCQQWTVAVENLLDNQVRYAKSRISVSLSKDRDRPQSHTLRIWNDGPSFEENVLDTLFEEYTKGKDGMHGLGLAIVKQIADLHQAEFRMKNKNEGVAFFLSFKNVD